MGRSLPLLLLPSPSPETIGHHLMESDTGAHSRSNILSQFLRSSRPRSALHPTSSPHPTSQDNPVNANAQFTSGYLSSPQIQAQGPLAGHRRGNRAVPPPPSAAPTNVPAAAPAQVQPSSYQPPATTVGSLPSGNNMNNVSFTQILRRRRSANNTNQVTPTSAQPHPLPPHQLPQPPSGTPAAFHAAAIHSFQATPQVGSVPQIPPPPLLQGTGPSHRIRLVPHLENARSLHFDPITRECREGSSALRIGRFTDRNGSNMNSNSLTGKIAFKSKVVSRGHAEIWFENGKFHIKDTSSSSGTFLNHTRLSLAGVESRAFDLKDGDILQLGVDYQGGTEEIYRCVKIRVEIGREWQNQPNAFNTNALAQLQALSNIPAPASTPKANTKVVSKAKTSVGDCCICLFPVTVCQALFIAPCSHSFHYKCLRNTLNTHHPGFNCPLCRSFHDLEADVEVDLPVEEEWEEAPADITDLGPKNDAAGEDADVEADSPQQANGEDDMEGDGDYVFPRAGAGGELSLPPVAGRGLGRLAALSDDDLPHAMQTAAEDNDRRLVPRAGSGFRNSRRITMVTAPAVPSLPTPTVVNGPNMTLAGLERSSSTDEERGDSDGPGGIVEHGEQGMDVDEPRRLHGYPSSPPVSGNNGSSGRPRSRSRVRATLYGLMGSLGAGSASNLNHHNTSDHGHGPIHTSNSQPNTTSQSRRSSNSPSHPLPPLPAAASTPSLGLGFTYPDHPPPPPPQLHSNNPFHHNNSNSNIRRVPIPAHLYGDLGVTSNGGAVGLNELGVLDDQMSGGEERTTEGPGGATMVSKRKR